MIFKKYWKSSLAIILVTVGLFGYLFSGTVHYSWKVGSEYSYQFKYQSSDDPQQSLNKSLSAKVFIMSGSVFVTAIDDELLKVKFDFSQLDLSGNTSALTPLEVYVKTGVDHNFEYIYYPESLSSESLYGIVELLTFLETPVTKGERNWNSIQALRIGLVSKVHRIKGLLINRFGESTVISLIDDKPLNVTYDLRSEALINNSALSLSKVSGSFERSYGLAGNIYSADKGDFSFILNSVSNTTTPALVNLDDLTKDTLALIKLQNKEWNDHYEDAAKNIDLDSFKESILSTVGSSTNFELLDKPLNALLATEVGDVADYLEMIESLDFDNPNFEAIATTLQSVGNEFSQKILLAAIQAEQVEAKHKQLVLSLAFVDHPTKETLNFLIDSSMNGGSINQNVVDLAAGVSSNRGRIENRQEVQQFYDFISSKVSTNDDLIHNLNVMGNIGSEDSVDDLQNLLSSDDETVVARALWTLRFVETTEAKGTLLTFTDNKSSTIRKSAIDALSYILWDKSVLNPVGYGLQNEVSEPVFVSRLYLIDKYIPYLPQTVEMLDIAEEKCFTRDLCNLVSSLKAKAKQYHKE